MDGQGWRRYKATAMDAEGWYRCQRKEKLMEIRRSGREKLLKKLRKAPVLHSSVDQMKLESFSNLVSMVQSYDQNYQLMATVQLRKWLSIEKNPPIQEVIKSGIVPCFIEFLTRDYFPQLQLEAAWLLTNIAAGTSENTKLIIGHGAIPIFVKLLSSPSKDICEQAAWALGNIAGDSAKFRDSVLDHGALMPLLAHLNMQATLSMLRTATWALSNFLRRSPPPPFDKTKSALPALALLIQCNDEEVLSDACWSLLYLSDGTSDKIQAVLDAKICPRIVGLLKHPSPLVLIPALQTVGNIFTGNSIQTQYMINQEALPCLLSLLKEGQKKIVKKEVCWTISNITAGNKDQIQAVVDAGFVGPLLHLLQTAELGIKKEAAFAIRNATSGGSHDQVKHLVCEGCIKPLCDLLVCSDLNVVSACLDALENILRVGEHGKTVGLTGDSNVFAQMIDEVEGFEIIGSLVGHANSQIRGKADELLEAYWKEEEEEDREGWLSWLLWLLS